MPRDTPCRAAALEELANDPDVAFINPDRKITATSTVSIDYSWMSLLGLTSPSAKAAYDGKGVSVAIIDSGIFPNDDLAQWTSRIVHSESFVPGDSSTSDTYGHGTHVAGIIGGDGSNSQGLNSSYF